MENYTIERIFTMPVQQADIRAVETAGCFFTVC
jgi:hypothetical protein